MAGLIQNQLTDWLNVFIITSDKPQMKLHVQCINDKVWTIKKKRKKTRPTVSIQIFANFVFRNVTLKASDVDLVEIEQWYVYFIVW